MRRIAALSVRRPKATLAVWLAVTVALAISAPQVEQRLTQSTLELPGTPSTHAMQLYRARFGDGVSVPILLEGPPAQLDRQGPRLVSALDRERAVRVLSPWDRAVGPSALRPSPGRALVLATLDRPASEAIQKGAPEISSVVGRQVSKPVTAHLTGTAVIGHAIKDSSFSEVTKAERLALPFLALVLLLVFRSPVAAAIPGLLGLATVAAGTGAISVLAQFTPIDTVAVSLVSMMGLALGVDYSLLIVSRFREELERDTPGDIRRAAAHVATVTAGRTVLFAGVALLVGMLVALLLAPGALLLSAAVGVIIATVLGVLGALTAVPAALALLGPNVNRWSIGRRRSASPARRGLLAAPRAAMRRPAVASAAILVGMLVLAMPAMAIKAGPPDVRQLPADNPARKDFDAVKQAMGAGWAAPFEIVSATQNGTIADPGRLAALNRMQAQIGRDPDVSTVVGPGNVADQTSRQVDAASAEYNTAGGKLRRGRRQTDRLASGLAQAGDGIDQLRAGLSQAASGAGRLGQGSQSASQGAAELANGLAAASAGANTLGAGLGNAQAGAHRLAGASGTAAQGASRLAGALEQIRGGIGQSGPQGNTLAGQLRQGAQGLDAVRQPAQATRQQLGQASAALAQMGQGRNDPLYQQAVQSVNAAAADASNIDNGIAATQGTVEQAAAGVERLAGQTGGILDQVTNGAQQLDAGIARLHQSTAALAAGIDRLAAGHHRLQGGLDQMSSQAGTLEAGVARLGAGADSLQAGLGAGYQRSAGLSQGLESMHSAVARFRSHKLDPAARRFAAAHAQSPDLFDSGYFVLAAINGTKPAKRRDAGFAVNISRGGSAGRVLVVPRSGPMDPASARLGDRLRRDANELGRATRTDTQVGGAAAQLADYTRVTSQHLLLLIVALAAATYLVLLPIFRSLILPAIAVGLNLLTVGAAFGILALLFQGSAPLGGPGYLDAVAVTAMYTVIFGLSMDYQVFLITRMREGYMRTHDTAQAISHGLGRTASLVTGAAAIMLAVFVAFSFASVINIRQFGLGLAVAVALDATVIRLVLLPAMVRLFGRWSWWLPAWLDRRLPNVDVEGGGGAAEGVGHGRAPQAV